MYADDTALVSSEVLYKDVLCWCNINCLTVKRTQYMLFNLKEIRTPAYYINGDLENVRL